MAAGQGPKPSAFYLERQPLTRLPTTPTIPGAGGVPLRTSNQAAGQIDPGPGNATPGDGLAIGGLYAITVSIWPGIPNGGATLSGAGTLLCWIYSQYTGAWSRASDFDLVLTDASGFPAKTFAAFQNVSRLGMYMNWLTSAVTATSADVLVRIDGFQSASSSST
jgi:hypothetical protein